MNKRDALRLRPGDRVIFGDSMWSAKVSGWLSGEVVFVTPKGGVKLVCGGREQWVPYHHIARRDDNARGAGPTYDWMT
jgi:hypothetical protein